MAWEAGYNIRSAIYPQGRTFTYGLGGRLQHSLLAAPSGNRAVTRDPSSSSSQSPVLTAIAAAIKNVILIMIVSLTVMVTTMTIIRQQQHYY